MRRHRGTIALCAVAIVALSACATRPSELAAPANAHLPERVELTHVPFFPQEDYQCGPAALATVLHSAGVEAVPEQLTKEVFLPARQGSLAVELIAATRSRGLVPYVVEPNLSGILEQLAAGRPVLVLQNVALKIKPVWHFAVVIGYDRTRREIILRSGTTERLVMSERGFLRTWDLAERWALLALPPEELPANPDLTHYMTAVAGLEAVGRLSAAERAYRRALEHWPDSVWPRLGLANIAFRRSELTSALDGYRSVLAIDPQNTMAHNNLAEILLQQGCIDEARRHVEIALARAAGTKLESAVADTAQRISRAPADSSTCTQR